MKCSAIIDVESRTIGAKFIPGMNIPGQGEPSPTDGQIVIEIPETLSWQCVNSVSLDDEGNWVFGEDVELKNQFWNFFRTTRNQLLAETDWTQLNDAPVDQTIWATYRQALRDLPAITSDPVYPQWPEKPQ